MRVVVLLCVVACVAGLSLPLDMGTSSRDVPTLLKKPLLPIPNEDGMVIEDVVNVHKQAIVLVLSSAQPDSFEQRKFIRETWVQALNRTSPGCLPPQKRREIAVWFVVPRIADNPTMMAPVDEEGKIEGDILIVNPPISGIKSTDLDSLGALFRWLRIAYFERFNFVMVVEETSFVSLRNLHDFCDEHSNDVSYYGGYVNGFEQAPAAYGHQYYAPFVSKGSLIMSYNVADLIAREMLNIRDVGGAYPSLGSFMVPFDNISPSHSNQFITSLNKVYSEVAKPVVIRNVSKEMMILMSTSVFINGQWQTPALPAQVEEFSSRNVYIDPHPTAAEPACDSLASNSECNRIRTMVEANAAEDADAGAV